MRNAILEAMNSTEDLGIRVAGTTTILDRGDLSQFYNETKINDDFGLIVKKRVFREYSGSGYFKPLVIPIWSRELKKDRDISTLYEQFVPSLVDVDVAGDLEGKRSYEIRMYYCMGDS